MILLIFAIVISVVFLIVEIPAYIRYHNEEDALLIILFSSGLVSIMTVLFFWRIT